MNDDREAELPAANAAWLAIVCTDRGQHKRTRLCTVIFDTEGHWRMTAPNQAFGKTWLPPLGSHQVYMFVCPRCPRTPKVSIENWRAAMARLDPRRDGVSQADLDMSRVPF